MTARSFSLGAGGFVNTKLYTLNVCFFWVGWDPEILGFPKIRGTILGALIIRTTVVEGLY